MKIAILCAAHYSFGHAGVGRALLHACGLAGHVAQVYSDQAELLRRTGFLSNAHSHGDLWAELRSNRAPDLVILDTVPFRRQELVFRLLASRSGKKQSYLCGHTGWLPYFDDRLVNRWRELLSLLSIKSVLLYHDRDVCDDKCHLAKLATGLGIRVVHSGLLLPSVTRQPNRTERILISAGGGAGLRSMMPILSEMLDANPSLHFDAIVGPYAIAAQNGLDRRICRLPFSIDLPSLLATYTGSITRAGYGACVDHIVAGTPAWFLPLPNAEQRANAVWVRPFLSGELTCDEERKLHVQEFSTRPPRSFDVAVLEDLPL